MPNKISVAQRPSGAWGIDCRLCVDRGEPKDTGLETLDRDEADVLANHHKKQAHPVEYRMAMSSPDPFDELNDQPTHTLDLDTVGRGGGGHYYGN